MRKGSMKIWGSLVIVAMISVFAGAQTAARTLSLSRDAWLGGQELSQGKYTITYDDTRDGELVVSRNGREVSRTGYKLVQLNKEATDNAVIFVSNEDGSLKIRRIEVKGSKTALQVE